MNTRRNSVLTCYNIHEDLGIVLFPYQHAKELVLPKDRRSNELLAQLLAVVKALNNEVTCPNGMKPAEAVNEKSVHESLPLYSIGRFII